MISRIFIMVFLLFPGLAVGQDFLSRNVAVHVKDMPVKNVLDQISENSGVFFTYAGNLKAMEKVVSLNIESVTLDKLLHDLFYGDDVVFTCYSNQVIIKKKPLVLKSQRIKGIILSSGNEQPVEFASLQMKHSHRGAVAGIDGKFEISANAAEADDSISVFRIGFEPRTLSVKALSSLEFHKIYLTPLTTILDTVGVSAKKANIESEGIKGVPLGSLYLDTHGQQVALFIRNKGHKQGRIKTLSFYLSGKGNTGAPFRIRLYGLDDSLKCPGREVLPDILVVKPNSGKGWFEVDVFRYNIRFPDEGIFIAMEGVYPGDYVHFLQETPTHENSLKSNDEFIEGELDYGQRVGYSRFSKNETWHYSLSNTWFQLDKKMFNVMISADILVYGSQKSKKKKL